MVMNNVDEWTTKIRLIEKRQLKFVQLLIDINGENQTKNNGSEPIPHVSCGIFGLYYNKRLRSLVEQNITRKATRKLVTIGEGVDIVHVPLGADNHKHCGLYG